MSDKKERRAARHEAQREAKRILSLGYKLHHSAAQVRAAARVITDRLVAEALSHV